MVMFRARFLGPSLRPLPYLEESFCDNDTALDKDVSEEEIAEMLTRMRTTARTQAFSRPG